MNDEKYLEPTAKQLRFAKQLGIEPNGMTRQQLSAAIDQAKTSYQKQSSSREDTSSGDSAAGTQVNPYIQKDMIRQILQKVNIVDVVSDHIPLEKKGRNYVCVCPFHDDHSPSLSVSQEKQIFKCFVCGESGNAITFVQKYNNISFLEACQTVAKKAGIELTNPEMSTVDIFSKEEKRMIALNELVIQYASYCLLQDQEALAYLENRKFLKADIDFFHLGVIRDEQQLHRFLLAKGFSEDDIRKSDLYSEKGYFRWKDRLLFPLYDPDGNPLGFSGRALSADVQPKYINTPESNLFHKREILYNLHSAAPIARRMKQVILMEGYMDVIKAHQHGIQNCVATCGTALTPEQIAHIKKLNVPVILCLDGDEAGLNAAEKNYFLLKKEGIEATLMKLPDGMDPDESLDQDPETFKNIMNNRMNYLDFKLSTIDNETDFDHQKNQIMTFMKYLSAQDNALAEEFYLKKLAEKTGFSYEALEKQYAAITAERNEKKEKIEFSWGNSQKSEFKRSNALVKINFTPKKRLNYKDEVTKNYDLKKDKVLAYDEEKVFERKDVLEKYLHHSGAVLETTITLIGYKEAAEAAQGISKEVVDEIARSLDIDRNNLESISYLHTDTKHPHIHLQIWQKEPFLDSYKLTNQLVKDLQEAVEKQLQQQSMSAVLHSTIKV